MKQMCLFVGNISNNVSKEELVDEFEKFGKCEVSFMGFYAFIDYDDDRGGAEDGRNDLNGKIWVESRFLLSRLTRKLRMN